MGKQWMELQRWAFPMRFFRENLKLGGGGEEGRDNDIARATFERTGASVMGKRMFDAGEKMWPAEAPFHTPVFVVTHEKRDPGERPGGTTFHFVNDGIETALERARDAAGQRDVRIAGGGETILEYLNAGMVEEPGSRFRPSCSGPGSVCSKAWTRAGGPGAGSSRVLPAGYAPDLRRPGAESVARRHRRTHPGSGPAPKCEEGHPDKRGGLLERMSGDVLLSHNPSAAVPSALRGLTSGFGMGPGISLSLRPP